MDAETNNRDSELEQLRQQVLGLQKENARLRSTRAAADQAHRAELLRVNIDPNATKDALRESEEFEDLILESATGYAILTTDLDGRVTAWNEGARQLLGWNEGEALGQDSRMIFTPEDRLANAPEQEMEGALTKGRAEDERWHVRKDGTRFWASGLMMPLKGPDEESKGFLKILRDRTEELHAAENQLRRLEQMKALAEAARAVLTAEGLEATLQAITDAARDIVGAHQAVCSMTRDLDWSQAITAVSLSGKYAQWKDYLRVPDGKGIYAWVCEGNRTVRMTQAELEAHTRWRGFGEHAHEHPPMRGWLATALVGPDGRNLGLIQLSDKADGEFDEVDETILVQLAQFAASAILRAQAEEEVRASAEFSDRILASSSDCIKVLDLEGRLQFMSAGGQAVMEVDNFETFRGCPWPEFWSGVGRDAAEAAVASAKAGGAGRFQGHALTAKGTPRWWDVVVTPINGADGKPERLLSVSRDITSEHLAREAVVQSEARLRDVLSIKTVGVMFWGEGFGLTEVNDAFLRMTGFSHEEVLRKTWQELTPPEFYPESWNAVREVTTLGETTPYEKQYFRKDGSRWWGLFAARQVGDEVVEFVLDITARKEAEEALRESEARFRAAVDAVQGVLWTNNAQGEMVGEQPGWAALTGQSYEDYQGFGWAKAVHPDDVQPSIDAWTEAVAKRKPFIFEHRVRRHDGHWRLFSIRAIPALDSGGQVREWVGVHTDITDLRARETELRDLNETLEQRIAEALAERAKAEEQLRQSQKMEAVGQLTGGLAHDFNNLLAGIVGSLDLMQARVGQGRTADLDRYIGAAMTSAQRAAALTHRLLAFSRRQPLDPKPVDANRLVAGMEDLLQRTLGPAVELEMVLAGGLWRTLCDPVQLESALLNLSINARDAMPDGGRLTIETANASLDSVQAASQRDLAPGEYVAISVTDTGVGMSPSVIARVFDPFFTTKPIGQGTGLGLSMVYGFAKQSGGDVRILSEEGRGTTLTLYLPRHRGEVLDDEAESRPSEASRAEGGETVLVVEDEPVVRGLVVEVLRELGYQAIEAADGPSGLKALQSRRHIDLLVTDIGLPGINGRQLADQGRETRPNLKVLFITGYAENATFANGFLEPGMAMLTKPFAVDALTTKVSQLVEQDARP